MDFLVEMRLADSSHPTTPQEGITLIEQYVFPTLELCQRLEVEKKIVAGGPVSGANALQELDEVVPSGRRWRPS